MAGEPMLPWKRPARWWLRNPHYTLFMYREVGGVLAAVYGLLLLYQLVQFHGGRDAYDAFLAFNMSPPMLFVNFVLFVFVTVHAVSWFSLIGKAQPIKFTAKPLSWKKAFAANLVLWAVASGLVIFIVFGGL